MDRRSQLTRDFFSRGGEHDALNIDLRNASYASAAFRDGMSPAEYRVLQRMVARSAAA